jgi:hypothetical protein
LRSMASDIHGNGGASIRQNRHEADLGAAAVGDKVHVLLATRRVEAKEATRHRIAAVSRRRSRDIGSCSLWFRSICQ